MGGASESVFALYGACLPGVKDHTVGVRLVPAALGDSGSRPGRPVDPCRPAVPMAKTRIVANRAGVAPDGPSLPY